MELFYKTGGDIFPFTLLAKNKDGVKEIYRILSNAYINNFDLVPLASLTEIDRKNVLIGTSLQSEAFDRITDGWTNQQIKEILSSFDYVLIPPTENLKFECYGLVELCDRELKMIIERVIDICDEIGVLPVASDEAIYVYTDDVDCEKVLLMQKGLASYKNRPLAHFRNTEEMLLEFNFLTKEKAEEIVIENQIGTAIVTPKDPTRDGFTFMGWAYEEGNMVAVPETMPYDETVLTAVWQANVDIKYDTDGDGV
ncbi:MAG: hypothetical protein J6V36_01905, partial [Clostridia bacterium]|nr:hypothetical protein [Clostridia bacterium]